MYKNGYVTISCIYRIEHTIGLYEEIQIIKIPSEYRVIDGNYFDIAAQVYGGKLLRLCAMNDYITAWADEPINESFIIVFSITYPSN